MQQEETKSSWDEDLTIIFQSEGRLRLVRPGRRQVTKLISETISECSKEKALPWFGLLLELFFVLIFNLIAFGSLLVGDISVTLKSVTLNFFVISSKLF